MLFELTINLLKAIFCRFFILYLCLYMHLIDYYCHLIDVIANIVQDLKKTFLYN
jgi:hypothetical protein